MRSADFVERWQRRASESPDSFDRFFSAWTTLVIATRDHLTEQQISLPDTDRKALIQFLESRADSLLVVLAILPDQVKWLAQRKGIGTGKPILDVGSYSPQHLRKLLDDLAQVWSGRVTRKPRWVAKATAEMINHVRNNMFHILMGVLETCTHERRRQPRTFR